MPPQWAFEIRYRTLKACENGPEEAIRAVVDRIAEFEHSIPLTQDAIGRSEDDVRDRSNQLSSFVEAVGALNTILDMRYRALHSSAFP